MISKQAAIVIVTLFVLLQAACDGSKPPAPVQEEAENAQAEDPRGRSAGG